MDQNYTLVLAASGKSLYSIKKWKKKVLESFSQ